MNPERVTITLDSPESAKDKDSSPKKEANIENQGMRGDMDKKAEQDLIAIAKGKERYNDNVFLSELAKEGTESSQKLFEIFMTMGKNRLDKFSAFLSRSGADVHSIGLLDDQETILQLVKEYAAAPDDANFKSIEAKFPDLR